MIDVYVTADSLSCLFHRDAYCESIPEPFRMQENVSFHVTYSEYVNYIVDMPDNSLVKLSESVRHLKELAASSSDALLKYFMLDMAFAIAKEVCYADSFKKKASVIVPYSYSGTVLQAQNLLTAYNYYSKFEGGLREALRSAGFNVSKNVSDLNSNLYKIAVSLYGFALSRQHLDEVNLVYDIA